MMKRPNLSAKRIAIDKANASLIVIISVTVFITVFSIVAIRSLYQQMNYQSKVIDKKETTLAQVKENIEEVSKLNLAYQEFSSGTANILGGNPTGSGDKDGDNARIVLDALPSKYDYPALITSLNKLIQTGGYQVTSITGVDDEVNQANNDASSKPEPIEMPFTIQARIDPTSGKPFFELFERSIRPFVISNILAEVEGGNLEVTVDAKTFFQPEKRMNETEEVVR